jgi:DNA-binding MarR family transcriptional regulator
MPAPPKPQPDAAEALIAVAPLISRWIERLLAAHEPPLTVSQYLLLRAIARERLTGGELARRTAVSGPAVSQLLAGLAEAGLLERRADPEDRRHQMLTLSARGGCVYESAQALLRRSVGALLAGVPPREADALGRLLPRVEAELAGTPPPRKPPKPPKRPGSRHRPPREGKHS